MSDRIETVIWEAHTRWLSDPTVDVNPGVLILAALKAARIAVVDLPQPNSTSDGRYFAGWDVLGDPDSVRLDCFGHVEDADGATYEPDEAREFAAALLAAADAAEADR